MTNLDAFSFVLTTENRLLDDLDPVVSTRFAVRTKVPLLVGGRDFEVILVLERDFDRSAIMTVPGSDVSGYTAKQYEIHVQIDVTIWKVRILHKID